MKNYNLISFKDNYEQCPPPDKKARTTDKTPVRASVVQYGRWPRPSAQCTPYIHGYDVTAPSTPYQAFPGPSRPTPFIQGENEPPTALNIQAVDLNVSFKFYFR